MGGRGASSSSIGNMSRNQLADEMTRLKSENSKLFKQFFRDKSKTKERAEYAKNQARYEKLEAEIRKRDSASGVNQRAYAKDATPSITQNTTTYDRARANRIRNFDAWFNGGKK